MSPHKPVLTMDELREIAKGSDNIAEWARVELVRREAQAKVGEANRKYKTEAERKTAKKASQRKWREKKQS